MVSASRNVAFTLEGKKNLMQHYENEFYFVFINESKVFILICNSGIIKSNEWAINYGQTNLSPIETSLALYAPQTFSVFGLLNAALV